MGETTRLKAPFPWFGGKSRVADLVWSRFGDVPNYVEPFAGSLAVLLGRPTAARIETVNDKDGFVCNAWRAIEADPEGVARWADWPAMENDLHARHFWLLGEREELTSRLEGDPEFFDVKIAGWWLWGIALWIGGGWCCGDGPWVSVDGRLVKRDDSSHAGVERRRLHLMRGQGVHRKRPALGDRGNGRGVHRKRLSLANVGRGVKRRLPELKCRRGVRRARLNMGMRGLEARRMDGGLVAYMEALAERLRRVRVCCGDWARIVGPSPTVHVGLTGVFLDPPYAVSSGRDGNLYAEEAHDISGGVRAWAIEHGGDRRLRIALCGYEGEHEMPADWECVAWKAHGGYGVRAEARGRANAHRERIWFSPGCLRPGEGLWGSS